ncbi:DUF3846 domain-containing protein [Streptomyces sp. NPDC088175]|uniref:DUF3846 domain-containing protein n=1 Tax=unclassified Streptomyces TaxID=2593676 RepID=UPI00381EFBEC
MSDAQKSSYALILRANGEFEIIDWPTSGTLGILYTAIGCTSVEAVTISPRLTMWLDGEGLSNGAPINTHATILYALHQEPHQHYQGTAVITSGPENGVTQGLTRDEIAQLVEFFLTFTGARIPSQRTK